MDAIRRNCFAGKHRKLKNPNIIFKKVLLVKHRGRVGNYHPDVLGSNLDEIIKHNKESLINSET